MIIFFLSGIFLLGVCIFVHELGHYLLGRAVGVRAETFSIGYGKGVWKKKIGHTTWQITAFPLGGFVKFYGDDLLKWDTKVPHGLFSVGPWTRMIPVLGGPFFNLLLGLLIYIILNLSVGSFVPEIFLDDNVTVEQSPAAKAGLQTGDRVLAIDGQDIKRFEEIQKSVAFSGGRLLEFQIERDDKIFSVPVQPQKSVGDFYRIGIRLPGSAEIRVNLSQVALLRHGFSSLVSEKTPPISIRAKEWLRDGDIIRQINGVSVQSIRQLQDELEKHEENQPVRLNLERPVIPWLFSQPRKPVVVEMPVFYEYTVTLSNLIDKDFGQEVEDLQLFSGNDDHQRALNYFRIPVAESISFIKLYQRYGERDSLQQPKPRVRGVDKISLRGRQYSGDISAQKLTLLGFRPSQQIDEKTEALPVGEAIRQGFEEVASQLTLYGVFFSQMFQGESSVLDNAAGPVKIFGIAGQVIQSSFTIYLQLFAAISIALCIMNLLPIPILDGGHLLFYLIEGVRGKPLSPILMAHILRYSFLLLMILGLYILYQDFLWVLSS